MVVAFVKAGSARTKYRSKFTKYKGKTYHSQKEANFAAELDTLKRVNQIKDWRRQVPIKLVVNGSSVCSIVIDFVVTNNNGTAKYIEVKGFETPEWKLKWKLFCALYPHLHKRIVR